MHPFSMKICQMCKYSVARFYIQSNGKRFHVCVWCRDGWRGY